MDHTPGQGAHRRQVLFDDPSMATQLRYFEVAPGGWTTLERHEHVHNVMVIRGRGRCLVGEKAWDLALNDLVSVPPLTWHQFRAAPGEPGRMGIQITAPSVPARFGPVAAAWHGVRMTGRVVHAMVTALARMLVGQAAVEIKGPVGISIMSREIGEQGWNALLEFMALLSINLGVINLFPLPALDGGRLLFIAAEAVRGRRMEPSREAIVHLVGFVLVIGLMAAITMLEVARLTGWVAP